MPGGVPEPPVAKAVPQLEIVPSDRAMRGVPGARRQRVAGQQRVVAQSHYLQILDKHFEAAVGEEPRKNVAQNPAQSGAELVRTTSQPTCGESSQVASVQRDTAPCETVPFPEVTPWGFEPQFLG